MRIRAAAVFASLIVSLAVPPAVAQEQAAPRLANPAPADESFTASHLRAAREVIDLLRADRQFDDILPQLATRTQELFIRSNPAITREIEETVLEVALEMAERRAELSRTQELIWVRRFSEEELGELRTFLTGEVGKKFAELSPSIATLFIGAARQWEEQLAAAMVEASRAKLREQGYAL